MSATHKIVNGVEVPLTQEEAAAVEAEWAANLANRRQLRTFTRIYTLLGNLSAQQQANIWSWLSEGNPPRWAEGLSRASAAAAVTLHWSIANSVGTNAAQNDAKRRIAALYAMDNLTAFAQPAWDQTIDVAGDEPVS